MINPNIDQQASSFSEEPVGGMTSFPLFPSKQHATNKTHLYTYDNAGNITSKKTYPYTTASTASVASKTPTSTYSYTYEDANWGDRLSSYRDVSFTYDSLGNPTSYYNGTSYTMRWQKGRQVMMLTLKQGHRKTRCPQSFYVYLLFRFYLLGGLPKFRL